MTYLFTSKLNLLITISSFYYFTVGEIWLPRLCFRGKCSRDKSHFPGRRGPKHDGRSWKAVEETENTAFCTFRLCLRFACPWNLSSSPVFCYPEFSTENTFQKISSCQIFQISILLNPNWADADPKQYFCLQILTKSQITWLSRSDTLLSDINRSSYLYCSFCR